MKKILCLLIAVIMVASLATAAFAAQGQFGTDKGSITINDAHVGTTTYKVYRLFDLESYTQDSTTSAYAYVINSEWQAFFDQTAIKEYYTLTDGKYVSWSGAEDESRKATFAKLALAWAQDPANGITVIATTEDSTDYTFTPNALDPTKGTLVFNDLDLGYYLVDSNAGALCGLTTTNPNGVVNAKNFVPTVDKQVQEDLTHSWGGSNTADIGQTVYFKTTITVAPGAQNYVLHDMMSKGLTFNDVTKVEYYKSGVETPETMVEGTDYEVITTACPDCDDPATPETETCTFRVKFTDSAMAKMGPNDRIVVYYDAMLNRYAEVGPVDGNTNESWMEYGEKHFTTHDTTKTYTFSFDLVKTDASNKLITGATFKIYDAETGGNEIKVVPMDADNNGVADLDANGNIIYRRARPDEQADPGINYKIEVTKPGAITVLGLDNGVYYLEEIDAPEGFNKLAARQAFTIADNNLNATFTGGLYSAGSGVHVVNKTGNMLPETGGMGTFLFITFGTLVVLGTGVLLVTKKRMSMIED